jgi:hypothetical protein
LDQYLWQASYDLGTGQGIRRQLDLLGGLIHWYEHTIAAALGQPTARQVLISIPLGVTVHLLSTKFTRLIISQYFTRLFARRLLIAGKYYAECIF